MNESAVVRTKDLKCNADLNQRKKQLKRDCEKLERERNALTGQMMKIQSNLNHVHTFAPWHRTAQHQFNV